MAVGVERSDLVHRNLRTERDPLEVPVTEPIATRADARADIRPEIPTGGPIAADQALERPIEHASGDPSPSRVSRHDAPSSRPQHDGCTITDPDSHDGASK